MNKAIAKNAVVLVSSEAINIVCGVVVVIALARVLSVADFGLFSFAYSLATLIYFASYFGMFDYAIRAVARDPQKAGAYFYNILVTRSALILAGLLALDIILRAAGYPEGKRPVVLLIMSARLIESLMYALFAYFRAFQKMKYEALIRGALYLVSLAAALFAIFRYKSITAFATAQLIVYSAFFAITFFASARFVASRSPLKPFSIEESVSIIRGSSQISVIQMLITLYLQTNTILLNVFKGDAVTGIYAAGYRFVSIFGIVGFSLTQAMFPQLSKIAAEKDGPRLRAASGKAHRYLFWIAFSISAGLFALAPQLINIVYGPKFRDAILPFYVMAFTPLFVFLNTGNNYILYALDREKTYLKLLVITFVFAIVINLILLPRFGAMGAAMTTIIPEVVFCAMLSVAVRRSLKAI